VPFPTRSLLAALALLLAAAAPPGIPRPAAAEPSLVSWLRSRVGEDGPEKTIRYSVAKVDLDGDGVPEALVYLSGEACGTGGCDLEILRRHGAGWRLVTEVSLVKLPIRVLATKSHGWRDLGVQVSGGGIIVGYEAILRSDGRTYPENPTVPPARRARRFLPGEIVLSRKSRRFPLYP
jgi:hypothetical protein